MTDPSADQTIRTAFAGLRASERDRIHPPGPDAARRTVRRRRRLGAVSVTAGFTALLAIGAGYLAGAGQHAPQHVAADPASVVTVAPSTPVPSVRHPELDHITVNAASQPGTVLWVAGGPPQQSDPMTFRLKRPGSYLLKISCGNTRGSITVTVEAGGTKATATARCATTADAIAAGTGETTFAAAGRTPEIRVRVRPDSAALASGINPVMAFTLSRK